ncbi:hypothetical protein KCTC52924_01688 [Arenibacter antarcticus]|uniref:DUF4271 domain-containing protein n=1 Tax=Arenibacter antarcticus TaxID=2040469 RepID=A0ABW5VJ58_9FLAO|nr:DUF4271 domain-containing protein [Arenibacter sp. H213]MCM4166834.1 DUF4271 domain-containing protein [Arenibacter sp. H213]
MEAILRNPTTADWITLILFSSILFMVLAKNLFYSRFLNFIILPFNNKYIFMYNKKDKLFNWFNIFITGFQILNLSLFLFFINEVFFTPVEKHAVETYGAILLGLIVFLMLKLFFQLSNGFIFNSKSTISEIVFKKLSYLNYSGIIMLLANLALNFIFPGSKTVVFTSILLILLINIMGWATALRNHQNFIASNFMYFILYLCALEIAPIILIGSYLLERSL